MFIGRARELTLLTAELEAARDGRGGAVWLTGEPGIGKSATLAELARRATTLGFTVNATRAAEAGFGSAFEVWRTVLAPLLQGPKAAKLVRALGPHAPSLSALVPSLRESLADPEATAPLDVPEQRARLFEAVRRAVAAAAAPSLWLFEDLQWADLDSLQLLEHVATSSGGLPALFALSWREPASDALTSLAAGLRRSTRASAMVLSGLDAPEAATLIEGTVGHAVDSSTVARLRAETAGNPFFLSELARSLDEGGTPRGVRDVVGHRVTRLPAQSRELLGVASAFPHGFDAGLLSAASGRPLDGVLSVLEPALAAGLVRAGPRGFELSHDIVRRAVLDGLAPVARARACRAAAEALASGAAEPADVASLYFASRELPGAERGADFALEAAARARQAGAPAQAAALLRAAQAVEGHLPPDRVAALTWQRALAEAEALELDHARQSLDEALALQPQAATPLEAVARAMKDNGAARSFWEPPVRRALAGLPIAATLERARLTLLDDPISTYRAGALATGRWLGHPPVAVALARESHDDALYAATVVPHAWRSRDETGALLSAARAFKSPAATLRTLDAAARDLLHRQCDYPAATEVLEEMAWTAERFGAIAAHAEALYGLAKCRAILGDVAAGRALAARVPELVARLGASHRLRTMSRLALNVELDYLGGGDWAASAEAAAAFATSAAAARSPVGMVSASFAALGFALAGQKQKSLALLAPLAELAEQVPPETYQHAAAIELGAAALWHLEDDSLAARYLALLSRRPDDAGAAPIGCTELQRARLKVLLDDRAGARTDFAAARKVLEQRRYPAAIAMADCDEATVAPPAEAAALAQAAVERFTALKLEGWADRARALLAAPAAAGGLTAREREVLAALAAGKSSKEIASALFISVATVNRHIANIYAKTGSGNRADATRFALEHGLLRGPA